MSYDDIFPEVVVCIGQNEGKQGRIAYYDWMGTCIKNWERLTFRKLENFALSEAQSRDFLKAATVQMCWINFHGQIRLFVWAKSKKGNDYSIIWSLNGISLGSWSSFCDSKVNQAYIESMKDWKNDKGGKGFHEITRF